MVNIAILGFGTVGSGVADVLTQNSELIKRRTGQEVRVKYIVDVRDFEDSCYQDCFVKDFSVVEQDADVDIVVETIGGAGVALDFTTRALNVGKSVITSNKELVAMHGYTLLQLAQKNGANYLFEASVGGGIPVIRPMQNCLAGNEFSEVRGILNGTTNYILTQMIQSGCSFEQALLQAQNNGYAERDPSSDVDGHDACRKICILAAIAFGEHVYPHQVPTEGIRGITLADVAYAESAGYHIKLLGRASHSDGKVCAFVAPHLVAGNNPLSGVEGVFNAVSITGDMVGDVMFYGPGAGKLPTASAVVGDVIDLAKNLTQSRLNAWGAGSEDMMMSPDIIVSQWYLRANVSMENARNTLGEISPLARGGAPVSESAFLTSAMNEKTLREKLVGMDVKSLIRVLD